MTKTGIAIELLVVIPYYFYYFESWSCRMLSPGTPQRSIAEDTQVLSIPTNIMLLHSVIASSLFTMTLWSINIYVYAMRHKLVLLAYRELENLEN